MIKNIVKNVLRVAANVAVAFAVAFILPVVIMIGGGVIAPGIGLALWKLGSIACPVVAFLWLVNRPWVIRRRVKRKRAKAVKEAAETARAARKDTRYAKHC